MTLWKPSLGLFLTVSIVAGAPLAAQTLSGSFASNPVQVGQTITLTVTDATGNGFFANSSSCYGRTVLALPGGPVVFAPMICTADIVFIAPNGSWTVTWNQTGNSGQQVLPGTYWFAAGANGVTNYFPITIQANPQEPTLLQTAPAQVNQPLTLSLQSPLDPGALYLTAFSLTTNTGFASNVGFVALDQDFLYLLSLSAQPPWLFANTVGTLDSNGDSPPIIFSIPNLPSLAYKGLATQSVLLDSGGQLVLSNPLTFTIAP